MSSPIVTSTSKRHPHGPRVLVIALAEATFDLLLPWIQVGDLPALSRLLEDGTCGRLRSEIPLITPQMWSTIVTGKPAGYHGIFDFWQRGQDGRFYEINSTCRQEKAIWEILSDNGLASGIVNVPCTYPPQKINGFMVAGPPLPGSHPSIAEAPSVYHEIVKKFGRYNPKDVFPGGRTKADYLKVMSASIEQQTDVLEYLMHEKPWDFFLTFYRASAMAQHYFWADMHDGQVDNPFRTMLPETYRNLDRAVDRLLRAAGPETLTFVMSDCGAGPLAGGVNLSGWLQQEGFLVGKHRKASPLRSLAADSGLMPKGYGAIAWLRYGAKRYLPKTARLWMNRHTKGLKAGVESHISEGHIDWRQTRTYSRGQYGHIFINLKGRERFGIVQPGREYEQVRSDIIDRLESLVDPHTGVKAVTQVHRSEERYEGPWVPLAPDLIVEWRDSAYMPTEIGLDETDVFVSRWRSDMNWPTSGSHRLHGILLAHGPGVERGKWIEEASIIDLMPTWLHCLGLEVPPDSHGRILNELFST